MRPRPAAHTERIGVPQCAAIGKVGELYLEYRVRRVEKANIWVFGWRRASQTL